MCVCKFKFVTVATVIQRLIKMSPSNRLNEKPMESWIKAGYEHVKGTLTPQPISRPKFTLTELKNAIPAHCFKRSMIKSFGYLTLDLVIIISLLCCTYITLEKHHLPLLGQVILYSIYWYVQGIFLFAIWVLAHECGEFCNWNDRENLEKLFKTTALHLQDTVHFRKIILWTIPLDWLYIQHCSLRITVGKYRIVNTIQIQAVVKMTKLSFRLPKMKSGQCSSTFPTIARFSICRKSCFSYYWDGCQLI